MLQITALLSKRVFLIPAWTIIVSLLSCTRKDIQFGESSEDGLTTIALIDTISVNLSSVIQDSFETTGASSFLVGKYSDPYLGIVSTKGFFQMTSPTLVPTIPLTAVFDSLSFIIYPNNYYYGDTSRPQTFYLYELAQDITFSYNNQLFNTSNVPIKPVALGSRTVWIRPASGDSITIRLNDAKGAELFSKLKQASTDVSTSENFVNYFKGISLTNGDNDTTAVYGFKGTMIMRLYYHNTIPYADNQFVDFTLLTNNYSFNQIIANRAGTGLNPSLHGVTEISSSATNNHSFMQAGTGLYLKMTFPSLRSILNAGKIIKILKAELILQPARGSFDENKYKLPPLLHLAATDETNLVGAEVLDSTGGAVQHASPVIDQLYGQYNYYRFDVTTYMSQLLTTAGSEDHGFYLLNDQSAASRNVDRIVLNNALHGTQSSKLLLSVITVNQ